jgi:predicted dehydrogenase
MFESEAALDESERMEFVAIVTPNHLHVPVAIAAAEAGYHVMSDKPAGISSEEVRELSAVLRRTGKLYGLTHTYLGYPMVRQARHLVASGAIGDVRRVMAEYPQGWMAGPIEESGNKQAAWRIDPARAGKGGALGDIGTHAHNLAEFITGHNVTQLSARLRTHRSNRVLDDDGEVSVVFDNGATGIVTFSQVCAGEENALKIRIYGEKGGLEWSQMEPNSLIHRVSGEPFRVHRAGVEMPLCDEALAHCRLPSGHPEGYLEAFANLYRHFATALRDPAAECAGWVPGITAAIRGMAFIDACVASSEAAGAMMPLHADVDADYNEQPSEMNR